MFHPPGSMERENYNASISSVDSLRLPSQTYDTMDHETPKNGSMKSRSRVTYLVYFGLALFVTFIIVDVAYMVSKNMVHLDVGSVKIMLQPLQEDADLSVMVSFNKLSLNSWMHSLTFHGGRDLSSASSNRNTQCTMSYVDNEKRIDSITRIAMDTDIGVPSSSAWSTLPRRLLDLSMENTIFMPAHEYIKNPSEFQKESSQLHLDCQLKFTFFAFSVLPLPVHTLNVNVVSANKSQDSFIHYSLPFPGSNMIADSRSSFNMLSVRVRAATQAKESGEASSGDGNDHSSAPPELSVRVPAATQAKESGEASSGDGNDHSSAPPDLVSEPSVSVCSQEQQVPTIKITATPANAIQSPTGAVAPVQSDGRNLLRYSYHSDRLCTRPAYRVVNATYLDETGHDEPMQLGTCLLQRATRAKYACKVMKNKYTVYKKSYLVSDLDCASPLQISQTSIATSEIIKHDYLCKRDADEGYVKVHCGLAKNEPERVPIPTLIAPELYSSSLCVSESMGGSSSDALAEAGTHYLGVCHPKHVKGALVYHYILTAGSATNNDNRVVLVRHRYGKMDPICTGTKTKADRIITYPAVPQVLTSMPQCLSDPVFQGMYYLNTPPTAPRMGMV